MDASLQESSPLQDVGRSTTERKEEPMAINDERRDNRSNHLSDNVCGDSSMMRRWEGSKMASQADLVDEFGRVHVSSAQASEDVAMPTVLTKLKKWADYAAVGDPVKPTKFLPMKTPMSKEIIDNWSLDHAPNHTLTIEELITSQERDHGRHVGLIIDLANHECLYLDDILSHNKKTSRILEYAHIQLVAKVLPPKGSIDQVERVAREFWSRKPDDYIAIHCAYGFNRTGFVLCSYLCQAHGLTVEEALEAFAKARPPGVKHAKFVNELYTRYGPSALIQNSDILKNKTRRFEVACPGSDGSDDLQHTHEPGLHRPPDSSSQRTEDLLLSTPPTATNSRSHPVGILAKSAPTSMRRTRSKCHVDEDSNDEEQYSRSYNSTGTMQYEDLRHMADTLKFNDSIRTETSIGLAKALYDDFGQHDFHADELQDMRQSALDDGDVPIKKQDANVKNEPPHNTNTSSCTII